MRRFAFVILAALLGISAASLCVTFLKVALNLICIGAALIRKVRNKRTDVFGFPCGDVLAQLDGLGVLARLAASPPCRPAYGDMCKDLR